MECRLIARNWTRPTLTDNEFEVEIAEKCSRWVPLETLERLELLEDDTPEPKLPKRPKNLSKSLFEQFEKLTQSNLFQFLTADGREERVKQVGSLEEFECYQLYQANLEQVQQVRSVVPGKIPRFKFKRKKGWLITPEECILIVERLFEDLETNPPEIRTPDGGVLSPNMVLDGMVEEPILNPTVKQCLSAIDMLIGDDDEPGMILLIDETVLNSMVIVTPFSETEFEVEFLMGNPPQQFRGEVDRPTMEAIVTAFVHRQPGILEMTDWDDISEEMFAEEQTMFALAKGFVAFNDFAAAYGGYRIH
ncbi:hypothetical protein [Tuwongella immobilis]|uniref:Uncharacterized protein n=1 Tax=Tuwongella immobilis TaxID=692036 RepID=A0A6C2YIR1_9BACT|nr:hypothetical protein [Tuwongella immobilis]VIP01171.1 unnamed protein product [Tuwongella immobilis]VTR97768.1 unnamed protein product [Tuwongella immobilis]